MGWSAPESNITKSMTAIDNNLINRTVRLVPQQTAAGLIRRSIGTFSSVFSVKLHDISAGIAIVVVFLASFDLVPTGPRPVAVLLLLLVALTWGFSPKDSMGRLFLPASSTCFVVWALVSRFWTLNVFGWGDKFFASVVLVGAVAMVTACVGLETIQRSLAISTISVIVYNFVYTVLHWSTATVSIDEVSGGVTSIGWRGALNHKNTLATFGVIAFVICRTLVKNRFIRFGFAGLSVALVLLSRSATGLFGLAAAFAMMWFMRGLQKRTGAARGTYTLGSSLLAMLAVVAWNSFGTHVLTFLGKNSTLTGRTKIWSESFRVIRQRPWVGTGMGGMWADQSIEPTRTLVRHLGFTVFHAHNGYIETVLILGVVGLVLHVWVLLATIKCGLRVLTLNPRVAEFAAASAVAIVCLSFSESLVLGAWLWMPYLAMTMCRRAQKDVL